MLAGKTALITGSTSGIGLGIAKALAHKGVKIVLNGLDDPKKSLAEISAIGVQVEYHSADMSQPNQIKEMIDFSVERFGQIDILVNNAGIQYVASVENLPVERWDAMISINLTSAFHTTRLTLPAMRESNWGRIINIASTHGLVGSAEKSAYVATKHGLIGLTKSIALETATTGITVNALCPGWTQTPLAQKQIDDYASQKNISTAQAQHALLNIKQPSLEFVKIEHIGDLAVFMCSAAADQVRGVAWQIDGGWTAQ